MAVEKEQIREFLDIESSELKNFIDSIDAEALIAARELILQAEQNHNRVHVTGIGKPGHVAGYAASLLSSQEHQPMSCMERKPYMAVRDRC